MQLLRRDELLSGACNKKHNWLHVEARSPEAIKRWDLEDLVGEDGYTDELKWRKSLRLQWGLHDGENSDTDDSGVSSG